MLSSVRGCRGSARERKGARSRVVLWLTYWGEGNLHSRGEVFEGFKRNMEAGFGWECCE